MSIDFERFMIFPSTSTLFSSGKLKKPSKEGRRFLVGVSLMLIICRLITKWDNVFPGGHQIYFFFLKNFFLIGKKGCYSIVKHILRVHIFQSFTVVLLYFKVEIHLSEDSKDDFCPTITRVGTVNSLHRGVFRKYWKISIREGLCEFYLQSCFPRQLP